MTRIAIIDVNVTCTLSMRDKLTRSLATDFEVITFTTGSPENLQFARNAGFNIVDVGTCVQNPVDIWRYSARLKKELKLFKPDICLTFTIRPAIWGNIITRWLGIPTITNITGIGPLFEKNNLAYRGARLLYKFVLSKTAKIFFQNDDDKQLFLENKFVTENRIVSVPGSGVDYQHFVPMQKTSSDAAFNFLFIGRLVKDKGIMEFLACASMLKKEFENITFTVIGPFWQQNLKNNTLTEAELQTWIEKGHIVYLGEKKDVRPFIANTDCVVLPSYREGTANVLLESCSMEKPCITCNVTGCKEIIEDGYNGFLCEARSVDSLYRSMKKMYLLADSERMEMGKNGRKKMIREFDKQIVIDAYLTAIHETLKSKAS